MLYLIWISTVPICPGIGALSVLLVIPIFTNVFVSFGVCYGEVSVPLVILPFTNISNPILLPNTKTVMK